MILTRNSKLINRKFIAYLIPSILMMFAMSFGSLLDGILIGNLIGNDALSATSLVLPILYVIQIPGFALGIGGSVVAANYLGKRDVLTAKKVFTVSIIVGLGISVAFAIISFFISYPLAKMFGESLVDLSYPYVFMYLLTDPIISFALIIGSFVAMDNNPKLSSAFYIISNVAKVGLEILFISGLNLGMYGAALSTAAGYFIGLFTLIFYVKSNKRLLSFTFNLKGCQLKDVLITSSTSGLNLMLTAVQMLVINIFIGNTITGDLELITYGLIANMVFVFDLFCGGVINLIPTLCSIFYGEKDIYSLKSITKKIYLINIGLTVFILLFIFIFPNVYSIIFGYDATNNLDYVSLIFRIFVFSFIPYEINKFSMNYYPSINKNTPSLLIVVLRQLIIGIPLTLILLLNQGLMGFALSYVIAEGATLLIAYLFILIYNKHKKIYKGIFMFETIDFKTFDISIDNDLNNCSVASEEIVKFCLSEGVANRESQVVGLAVEEICNNIINYGYKKESKNYIDINLKINKDNLLLRIRDDGLPFDPTKYEFDENENYSTSGIKLIENMTDKMSYMRIVNLNNTIFEIKIKGEK